MMSFEIQLDELLKKDPNVIIAYKKAGFRRIIDEIGERYVLFGAGQLGKITLARLRKIGIEPLAFTDNNSQVWGTKVDGLEVFSPIMAVNQFSSNAIFIITIYTSAPIWHQLANQRLNIVSFAELAWYHPEVLLPFNSIEYPFKIFKQREDVRKAFSLWADETSRLEYIGQLIWHTSLDSSALPPHSPPNEIYHGDNLFRQLANEVYVDCGAFDGDTILEFLKHQNGLFSQIIGIEPDPSNFKALKDRMNSLASETKNKVRTIQSAVGSRHELVTFNATGTAGSAIREGGYSIQCITIDELLAEYKPTFIKMDIEGAELDALFGAQMVIQKEKPILAICLYHAQEHLWQIPLLIHSFCDDYSLYLRRYSDECWELVCYAVPIYRSL